MSDVNKNEEVQYSDGLIQGSVESLGESATGNKAGAGARA